MQGWGAGKFLAAPAPDFFPNLSTISLCFLSSRRAEEPAKFLAAPAPDFFSKRLQLRLLVFFQAAPAPRSQKHPAPTGSPALENTIF